MFDLFEDYAQMLDLGSFGEEELEAMGNNKIEFRKKLSQLISKSKNDTKSENCYYCGEKCSGFCNSHSIPAFILKNIAVDGKVYSSNKLVSFPLVDEDKGVNKTGTFQIICRDCDGKIFSDYENPDSYKGVPTHRMITQIAMKNYLKSISKRVVEIALYDNMKTEFNFPLALYEQRQEVNNLDLQEYIDGFNRAKRVYKKGWENEYYLFYHKKLDYVVPFAFQNNITLLVDFEGNVINDIYNKSPNYKLQAIHICVFPLETSSTIMIFIDSKDKRYRNFYKQFRKLSPEDKLAAVNYMIFTLSEDVFMNKDINQEVLMDEDLIDSSRKTLDIISSKPINNAKSIASDNFDLSMMKKIPNLLLLKYKVR